MFAAQATVVLANAQAYWGARLRSEHLEQALVGREVIDMAKGIIMNAIGCGPDEAFDTLVKQSQQENRNCATSPRTSSPAPSGADRDGTPHTR